MKEYKKKWQDSDFLKEVNNIIQKLTKRGAQISNIDLSGIEIHNKSQIEELRKAYFYESNLESVNLSYAIISSSIDDCNWLDVDLFKAKLDGCIMGKAQIKKCNFQETKLIINADGAIFEDCSFLKAKFVTARYGYEYGGRRTKFYNCDFTDAVFKNQEFRASKFFNCNFTSTKFINCDLRGMKIEGDLPKVEQFENMDIPEFIK